MKTRNAAVHVGVIFCSADARDGAGSSVQVEGGRHPDELRKVNIAHDTENHL
jgi:hypothetical protein